MIEHFDAHLNIRQLILTRRPKIIVECGAGEGETTRMLAHMQLYYPFELHAISDKELDLEDVEWHTGLSYEVLKEFPDGSLSLVFLDTDHNYWTLMQELLVLKDKMTEGGVIVMHDVETFYYDTGMALSYWNDAPYPKDKIMECANLGSLGICVIDFLSKYRGDFKLIRFIAESNGMAVIERRTVQNAKVITPGSNPLYAKPVPEPVTKQNGE